jgi:hypothetical protein
MQDRFKVVVRSRAVAPSRVAAHFRAAVRCKLPDHFRALVPFRVMGRCGATARFRALVRCKVPDRFKVPARFKARVRCKATRRSSPPAPQALVGRSSILPEAMGQLLRRSSWPRCRPLSPPFRR